MKVVGKSIPRVDAYEKVTGRAIFTDDITFPGTLYVKILRSPHPHARIISINTRKAEKLSGVRKIIKGIPFEEMKKKHAIFAIGGCIIDQLPMAANKVRFVGEPVCAVVADDPDTAEEACKLIEVKYEKLPAVFDPRKAMEKDAPLVHPKLGTYKILPGFYPVPNSNIYHHYKLRKGDVEKAFKKCDVVIEREFSYPHMAHCQIEPHSAIAIWHSPDRVEIYSSTQSPFIVRDFVARAYNLPYSNVRVYAPYLGGGFGGKSDVTIEPLLVYIAKHIPDRWVKLTLDREEMFVGTVVGRGVVGKYKIGAKKDGTILACEIEYILNSGAYGEYGINVLCGGSQNSTGPYRIPNVKVDGYAVYTNLPYVGAFRGYGHPEGHFMAERMIEILAQELKMDPVKLRLKNALRAGDKNAIEQRLTKANGNLPLCIKKTAQAIGWKYNSKNVEKVKDGFIARDVSAFMKSPVQATNAHVTAIIKFNEDGTANLLITTSEMGQGSSTVYVQIASEALQIPVEKINFIRKRDTEFLAYDWQTVASKGTYAGGQAIIKAAEDAIQKIKQTASKAFRVPLKNIKYKEGFVYVKGKKLPITKFVNGFMFPDGRTVGGPVVGYGIYTPENLQIPGIKKKGLGEGQGNISASWTFGAQGVELFVNTKTKKIKIKKIITAIDAGKIINPKLARGQIVGGMVQALGQAIMEKIIYSQEGVNRNPRFTDYKIPTLEDLKDIDIQVIFVESPDKKGPFGARGLAEHSTVSIPACVANAVSRALNIEINEIPVNFIQISRR
ncbi:MAG: xanthine dehydrogenase family protein molybdopterin-binding subunit [Elusimicrobia bacterium]|nr:xanthine dehydrogenase family protein molybdopterin-binding subunit [Elusimicrobiota bacterium]